MSQLDDLKNERAKLDKEISALESREAIKAIETILSLRYHKVACSDCDGLGEVTEGGADIESDPPYQTECASCRGNGFLWARKFDGVKKPHDMDHNQVFPV